LNSGSSPFKIPPPDIDLILFCLFGERTFLSFPAET